ncbi:hypothetical protein [Roseomonas indoligenes]|uniref:hypothetical protein n=1 Tax=Roseomonas indoligenes TaxID=2820811 RepID=UPI001FD75C03|nr:hypothetical protein [Pararoseomonas indoligenes]
MTCSRIRRQDFNLRNGVAYLLWISPAGTRDQSKTRDEIQAETARCGHEQGTGWLPSIQGDYGALGLTTLAGLADLGVDGAEEARERLAAVDPPFTDAASKARDPLLNVVR